MDDLLDIITITRNDLDGVAATIASTRVIRSLPGVRQIIVDSSDPDIREQVRGLSQDEKNIHYAWMEPRGIAPAFNEGLRLSQATWVWFLNGGDKLHHRLECEVFLSLLRRTTAKVAVFEIELMQSGTKYDHPPLWAVWPPVFFWVSHPATVLRRDLFLTYGNFREDYAIAMDAELWFRLFSKNIVVDMISFPIALFDEQGMSRQHRKKTAGESLSIILSYFWIIVRKWLGNALSVFRAMALFSQRSRSDK